MAYTAGPRIQFLQEESRERLLVLLPCTGPLVLRSGPVHLDGGSILVGTPEGAHGGEEPTGAARQRAARCSESLGLIDKSLPAMHPQKAPTTNKKALAILF
jgi:hypothetical protein